MIVALFMTRQLKLEKREDDMRWPLFTWMLAGGLVSMLWFLYLSMIENENRWKPVAQHIERHVRHRHRDSTLAKP